jgi:hypothetical protein
MTEPRRFNSIDEFRAAHGEQHEAQFAAPKAARKTPGRRFCFRPTPK